MAGKMSQKMRYNWSSESSWRIWNGCVTGKELQGRGAGVVTSTNPPARLG